MFIRDKLPVIASIFSIILIKNISGANTAASSILIPFFGQLKLLHIYY